MNKATTSDIGTTRWVKDGETIYFEEYDILLEYGGDAKFREIDDDEQKERMKKQLGQ